MNEAQNINFRLSTNDDQGGRRSKIKKTTLKNIFEIIDKKTISESLKEKLKNKAKNYPHQALNMFLSNIDRFIAKENKNNFLDTKKELEFPE